MGGRTIALLLVVGMLTHGAAAGAQTETAEALIEQGVAARRAGDDDGALSLFRRAWESVPSLRARAQMALAEQALGMWSEADTHLREVLRTGGDAWIESHRAALDVALAEIGARFGTLDVRCAVEGAEVRVNGEVLGRTPLSEPLRIPAGSVTVEVVAGGYLPFSRDVTIVAGQPSRETFTLRTGLGVAEGTVPPEAAGHGTALAAAASGSDDSGRSVIEAWWFWTIVGVVVVGAGVGIGVGVALGGSSVETPIVPPGGLVMALDGP